MESDDCLIEFHALSWQIRLDEIQHTATTFFEIMCAPSVTNTYIEYKVNLAIQDSIKQTSSVELPDEILKKLVAASTLIGLGNSNKYFSQLLIIIISSLFNEVLKEFAQCVFVKYPESLKEIVNMPATRKNKIIPLQLFKTESDFEKVMTIVNWEVCQLLSDKPKAYIQILEKITGNKFNGDFILDFKKHKDKRNIFGHEICDEQVTTAEINNTINSCLQFIDHIKGVCLELGIPVEEFTEED